MGRIGSGEMATIAFGLMGPLLYLALGVLLMLWGRHQARRGKGMAARVGWVSPLLGVAAALLGVAGTAFLMAGSFSDTASIPPESRALAVADGIGNAMTALGLGLGLSAILYAVSLIANVVATAQKPPPNATTPPP